MTTNFRDKIGVFGILTFIYRLTLPFQNGLEYRNADGHITSALNLLTLCRNMMMDL